MIRLMRPGSLPEALALVAQHGEDANLLAGGTALMLPERRRELDGPLIALTDVPELSVFETTAAGDLRIGALCTHTQVVGSPLVRSFCPTLAQAFARIATGRVRNQATIGGNLALADPAHDPPSILIALGARALLAHERGRREVDVADLARGPFASTLAADELLVEIRVPAPRERLVAHTKFLVRSGSFRDEASYPTVSCGAVLQLDDAGECLDARIGLSGAHHMPTRVAATEDLLRGKRLTSDLIAAAARAGRDGLEPIADERGSAGYKREMAGVWIERTLREALDG